MRRLTPPISALAGCLLLLNSGACARPAPAGMPQPASSAPAEITPTDTLQGLIDAAWQEGQLSLVWAPGVLGDHETIQRLANGFNEFYGLNLDVRFTPGPPSTEMAAKLAEEHQLDRRASTDIFIGHDGTVVQLIQADALAAVDWSSWAPNIRNPHLVAPRGMAVTFQSSIPGITYNNNRVTGDAVPTTLAALLKPEYKGRVASTPYASGFDRLATPELWGEQRAVEYATKLADQLGGLIRCNELERVASGEFDILALNCSQSNSLSMKAAGAPIDYTIPSDAPMITYVYLAVPRNAPHPSAARLWINYLLSRQVQDLLFEREFMDSHLVDGSRTARDIELLERTGVKFTVSNVEFIQSHDVSDLARITRDVQAILRKQR